MFSITKTHIPHRTKKRRKLLRLSRGEGDHSTLCLPVQTILINHEQMLIGVPAFGNYKRYF